MYTTASVNRMTENTQRRVDLTVRRFTCYAISARLTLVCGAPAFHAQLWVQVLWCVCFPLERYRLSTRWLFRRCLGLCPHRVFSYLDRSCRPGPGKCYLLALVGTWRSGFHCRLPPWRAGTQMSGFACRESKTQLFSPAISPLFRRYANTGCGFASSRHALLGRILSAPD